MMSKSRTGSTSPSTCVISLSSKVPEKLKKRNFKFELKNTKRIISYFFDRGPINIFVEIIIQKLVSQLVEWVKNLWSLLLKFIYSEKATKFCEIFPLLLTTVHTVKSKGKISQNFVAFSEYMNFIEVCMNPDFWLAYCLENESEFIQINCMFMHWFWIGNEVFI